jgi:hypothetical protein
MIENCYRGITPYDEVYTIPESGLISILNNLPEQEFSRILEIVIAQSIKRKSQTRDAIPKKEDETVRIPVHNEKEALTLLDSGFIFDMTIFAPHLMIIPVNDDEVGIIDLNRITTKKPADTPCYFLKKWRLKDSLKQEFLNISFGSASKEQLVIDDVRRLWREGYPNEARLYDIAHSEAPPVKKTGRKRKTEGDETGKR